MTDTITVAGIELEVKDGSEFPSSRIRGNPDWDPLAEIPIGSFMSLPCTSAQDAARIRQKIIAVQKRKGVRFKTRFTGDVLAVERIS